MYGAPEGIDPLRAGLLIDQFADNKDVAAAIIDLARMGYLRIEEEPTENPLAEIPLVGRAFKKSEMVLVRKNRDETLLTKEYRIILDELLFPSGDRFVLSERSDSRAKRFKEGYEKINKYLYEWSWKEGYMVENPSSARIRFVVKGMLVLLPFLALAIYQSAWMSGGLDAIFTLFFVSVFLAAGIVLFVYQKETGARIVAVSFILIPLFVIFSSLLEESGSAKTFFSMPFLIVLLAILPLLFFARYMGVYTSKGAAIYRHLLGFKEFIGRVKEDELRRFLEKDPAYLDKALPYAMVFGIADHWLKFYELLGTSTPAWFEGDRDSLIHLDRAFGKFSDSSQTGTSSGGSSGGGSFSGGGGGGGGGGSW